MENHPIPQDVTGFKFKLIGSVTIKQFLYLLGFGILTTVIFVLPINPFIRFPLMAFFAGIGAALAFVPIEGRPMDVMLINFAKAIPSENRYLFSKRGVNLDRFEIFKITTVAQVSKPTAQTQAINEHDEKKSLLLKKLSTSSFKPDAAEVKFMNNVNYFFKEGAAVVQKLPDQMPEAPIKPPSIPVIHADSEDAPLPTQANETIEKLKEEITEVKAEVASGQESAPNAEEKIKALEEQLQAALSEKDALSKKVVEYESDKVSKPEQVFAPGDAPTESKSVHFVAPSASLDAGFPMLPDIPNIVMGIIKDPRGKTLPNILVEVVDENSVPVRAFKTNALGQFAAATPLANGRYKMYFEDATKQHEFEIIEINLTGEIFSPIEVRSVDSREKLRRELFGGTPAQASA